MRNAVNIAVVIPTLNRPAELTRCLESLFQGTVLPAEVLIIDQGEYHVVEPLIQRFRSHYSVPIIHCSQSWKGLSAARNFASSQVRCPVIAFTDDDCMPASNWLEYIDQIMTAFSTVDGVTGSILPLEQDLLDFSPYRPVPRRKVRPFRDEHYPGTWEVEEILP